MAYECIKNKYIIVTTVPTTKPTTTATIPKPTYTISDITPVVSTETVPDIPSHITNKTNTIWIIGIIAGAAVIILGSVLFFLVRK